MGCMLLAALVAVSALSLLQAPTNLIRNGDFSEGNVGFESALPYVEPADNCLWPSGYTIAPTFNKPQLHRLIEIDRFSAADRHTGKEQVFFANAGGVEPVTVWSAKVKVQPMTRYRISFYAASLSGREDGGTPPRQVPTQEWVPDFEIHANQDIGSPYPAGLGKYYKVTMVWNSAKAKEAKIDIVRCRIEHGGGLIGISNIQMVPIQAAGASEKPPVTSDS